MKTELNNSKKKSRKTSRKRGPRYWILAVTAMGVCVAYTVGNSRAVSLAYVRENLEATSSTYSISENQTQKHRFDIPPGTLETVLIAFQKETGLQVVYVSEEIRVFQSPGVSGIYTEEQALKQLLSKTGVGYRFTKSDTISLDLLGPEESVNVEDSSQQILSGKYTEPLRDTPQTITVIPKEIIEEQGATTLRDVLRNVPGLTMTAGEGGAPAGDNLTLRGFSARNDIFVDGVRDLSPQSRDPFNLEQVEVVKGPTSAYSGRGSAGGAINLVSKAPSLERYFGGTLSFGTDKTKRVTGDINLPLKKLGLGERTAFRLNLLGHDSAIAGRDVVTNERWGIAPSLSTGIGTKTRLTFSYYKLKQDNLSDYGIPWVPATNNVLVAYRDRPAPVPRDTFYGFRSRDFEKLNTDIGTFKFEQDLSESFTLRNQLRYSKSSRNSMATPPRFNNNNSTAINREMRSWIANDEIWDNQTDITGFFSTGSVQHSIVTGVALTNENNKRQNRTAPNSLTTLLNPNPDDVYTGVITTNPIIGDVTGKSLALYVFDTVKLSKQFDITGGLRWDYFNVEGKDANNAIVQRTDRMTSGRFGIVYKPRLNGSIYASFGTSLSPSLEGLSYGTANTAIDPEKTYNYEVGSKWDLMNSRLLLSGAVFRVDKMNARTPGLLPGDPVQVLDGQQRVDGVELSVTGSLRRDWKVFAGYTFLDSEIVKSNAAVTATTPSEVGKHIQNTPKNSLNLWTTYQSPWKLSFGGGARYTGKRFGNNSNTRFVGGYWLFDAMVSYPVAEKIDLRLNLYNLTDKYYFDRLGGGHVVPGPGRSATVGTSFRF